MWWTTVMTISFGSVFAGLHYLGRLQQISADACLQPEVCRNQWRLDYKRQGTIGILLLSSGKWVLLGCLANQKQRPIFSTPLPRHRGHKAVLCFKGLLNKEECQRQEAERLQRHLCMPSDVEKPVTDPKVTQPRPGPAVTLTWVGPNASTLILTF